MIVQLSKEHEVPFCRFLLEADPILAFNHILVNYYFAPTDMFGARAKIGDNQKIEAVALYSIFGDTVYISRYLGDPQYVDPILETLGSKVQMFWERPLIPDSTWRHVLSVTPGYMIDHPAYSGVFNRSGPRFHGAVYERG